MVEAVSSINVSEEGSKASSQAGSTKRLFLMVAPVLIDLIVWSVVVRPSLRLVHTGSDLKYYICQENWMDHGMMGAQFLFLLWGVFLCFQRRNVTSQYNEGKHIGWAVYFTIFWRSFITVIRCVPVSNHSRYLN